MQEGVAIIELRASAPVKIEKKLFAVINKSPVSAQLDEVAVKPRFRFLIAGSNAERMRPS
jgi:hypothetical protein